MRSVIVTETKASRPRKASLTKSTSASSAARSGPGFITFDSSSTAICVLRRVTIAPPMNTTHIRP